VSRALPSGRRGPDVRRSALLLAALFAAPAALGASILLASPPEERFPAAGGLEVEAGPARGGEAVDRAPDAAGPPAAKGDEGEEDARAAR
jgi:hypothetical protein